MDLVWIFHLVVASFFTGTLWFALLIHYPLLARAPKEWYPQAQQFHIKRTMFLAYGMLVLEAASGLWLLVSTPQSSQGYWLLLSMFLLVCGWVVTWSRCLPGHKCLRGGFAEAPYRRLYHAHVIRTLLWSARVGVLCIAIQA